MKHRITIGMDLGDKKHVICELDSEGNVIKKEQVINTEKAIRKYFSSYDKAVVVMCI